MSSSQIKKVKSFGIGGVSLAIVLGSILVIYPFFNEAETLKVQVAEKKSENSILLTRIDMLKKISGQIPEVKAINDSLSSKFPATSDIPGLVSSLGSVANSVGLGTGAFTNIETSIPVVIADTAAALPQAGSSDKPAAATGPVDNTDAGTGTPAGAAPTTGSSGSNLASMTVTISVEGTSEQLSEFVKNLSTSSGRSFLIKSFSIDSSGADSKPKLTLETTAFLYRTLPDPVNLNAPTAAPAADGTTTPPAADGATPPAPASEAPIG